MNIFDRIELNPRICDGKPVIKGARIPISVILELIAEGKSWQAILDGYPELTRDDIYAALHYAKVALDHSELEEINV